MNVLINKTSAIIVIILHNKKFIYGTDRDAILITRMDLLKGDLEAINLFSINALIMHGWTVCVPYSFPPSVSAIYLEQITIFVIRFHQFMYQDHTLTVTKF